MPMFSWCDSWAKERAAKRVDGVEARREESRHIDLSFPDGSRMPAFSSHTRKKRDALEYLDLCVEPEVRLLASSDSRMRSHSRSACECYCKTRVPMAKQREEIRRERRGGGGKDGGSKSSPGKTETARSTRKASLISTNIAHRRQLDGKRSTATPAASPILSPETSAAIEDVEKLMKNTEIRMREIRVASDYSRLTKRATLYSNEAPLDDEADQLLYIRERVARKFDEANSNGCWMDPNFSYPRKSFHQRSCNEETSAAIESKRIVDFSAARFKSSDDPYEEFSQQRRRDVEKFGLSSTEAKKTDEETRKVKADDARTGKLETRSVQAGPSVNIKGELRKQNLDNVHISPDSSFAQETQNVATYVVRRDFEKRNESPRRRREKIVKITEDRASNGIPINGKIAKDRGSGSQNSEQVSRGGLANLLLAESKEKSVENVGGRIGEEEKENILKEKAEKKLEENDGESAKSIDANRANGNEKTSTKADKNSKGEGKQVRFDSFATQTDAASAESLNEAAKVLQMCSIESSSLSKEAKAKGEQTEERYGNDKNGRGEIGERCKAGTGKEDRYEKIGESFANVVAKYCRNGDACQASLSVANALRNSQSFEDSKNSEDSKYPKYSKDSRNWKDSNDSQNSETAKDSKYLKDSKDSKASKDVEYFNDSEDSEDSEDSQRSADDLSNFYEPALTELDNILITYDKMIDDVARSTKRVDEFLSRPEMEEYRQRSATSKPINAKSKRPDARKIEATEMDSLIKPPIERRVRNSAARDANALTRKDKRTNGCEFLKTKTSPVKKKNDDSKTKRGAAMDSLGFARNPRRGLKTAKERWKKEESASEWSENRTRDEKLMRITGMEETRSLENANWKHDSSSCIASSKSRISSGKEDWELDEKEEGAGNLQARKKETEARIEKEDPIGRILREESRFVEDEVKKLFNADEMVAVVVKSVLKNLKSDAAPDDFESFIGNRRRVSANFPWIDEVIEKEKSQDGEETLSATKTQKCDDEEMGEKTSSRVSEKSDRREESIAGSEDRSRSKGKESVDLRDSPPLESFPAKDDGNLQRKEDAGESLARANAVSTIEDKVEDAEERVGEVLRATDENEDDKLEDDNNETASNAKSEKSAANARSENTANARCDNIGTATRPDKSLSEVSTDDEKSSNVESKEESKENETDGPTMDDRLSSDSLRDCASLGSCSRNVSKEQLNKRTLEIADGESLASNVAFERERILADVYDEVNKKLFSSARIANRAASDRINQDRFSSGVSTVERNKVEISSESSHSEGELYGASSGSYSLGEIRMLSKSRSDGETTDFDDNIGAFVTKRKLASWNESSKSLVQSMGEI